MRRAIVRGDRCARAANGPIADLKLARRNDRGLVEFSADFVVLRPADVTRRNGTLLYEVNSRGNIAIFRQLNEAPSNNDPAATADAGNWFCFVMALPWCGRRGHRHHPLCRCARRMMPVRRCGRLRLARLPGIVIKFNGY
jgi:hypothetical protein